MGSLRLIGSSGPASPPLEPHLTTNVPHFDTHFIKYTLTYITPRKRTQSCPTLPVSRYRLSLVATQPDTTSTQNTSSSYHLHHSLLLYRTFSPPLTIPSVSAGTKRPAGLEPAPPAPGPV